MGLFSKVLLCVNGRLTKGHCLAVYAMSREIISIYRKSGPLFTGQYLKQVAYQLQWYVGGDKSYNPDMKIFVSLTRSGIPRMIPPYYRKILRKGSDPLVIKIILSILTLSRIILVAPKGGLRINPKTIHIPNFKITRECQGICEMFLLMSVELLRRYVPTYSRIPLKLGYYFRPLFSSGPNTFRDPRKEVSLKDITDKDRRLLTNYHTLPLDAVAILERLGAENILSIGSMWFSSRIVWVTNGYDNPIEATDEGFGDFAEFVESLLEPVVTLWWPRLITRAEVGRLGRKLEGSGKVRVFAIANPILQTLLRPLHDWLMSILGTLETDGTFNQHRPLHRLAGHKDLLSFDLRAATDLLPVDNTVSLFTALFGHEFTQTWHFLMSGVGFRSPDRLTPRLYGRVYKFTRGQPLGYYSSWPAFTLTHHMFVWMAAEAVYPGRRFTQYSILGDDIVIADLRVAMEYKLILERAMGIISLEKSLISFSGACEFAKRFIINNHLDSRMDVSPLSIPLIKSCCGFSAPFVFKTLGCSIRNSFRLKGGGYYVYSRVREDATKVVFKSKRWIRHWLSMHSPSGIKPLPVVLWLAFPERGVLSPTEYGLMRFFVLERVRPRDIDEESISRARRSRDHDNLFEPHLLSFMRLHLTYLKWYAECWIDFDKPLESLGNTGSQTFFLLANASLLLLPMSAPWALSKLTE